MTGSRTASAMILVLATVAPASSRCLVAGDSIAVGLGQALGRCAVDARVGLSSAAVVPRVHPGYDLTIISAGSNDPTNPGLRSNLRAARARASGRVLWIVPHHLTAAGVVRAVAAERGDRVQGFAAGRDGLHPRSYGNLARAALIPGVRVALLLSSWRALRRYRSAVAVERLEPRR